ncbi:MAG: carbonic anhydrase [Balneolales bacterium]
MIRVQLILVEINLFFLPGAGNETVEALIIISDSRIKTTFKNFGIMSTDIAALLKKNRNWATRMTAQDPHFFKRLAEQQKPQLLWIGCSDSRVPANQIIDAAPGEVFVHRNIANMVQQGDLNALSVLQYAVEVLKVRHILVCGHHACGGVKASLEMTDHGLIDNWIRPIKQIYEDHKHEFKNLSDEETVNRLCEWNVRQQVMNIAQTPVLQKAWQQQQKISVHGIIYHLKNGELLDMECSIHHADEIPEIFRLL